MPLKSCAFINSLRINCRACLFLPKRKQNRFSRRLPHSFVTYLPAVKRLTMLAPLLFPVVLFAQEQQTGPVVSFSSANLSLGAAYGIHPNRRNEYLQGFAFGEGDAALAVKNIPLKVSFRLSEEPYRSGR